jgi:glycosyltransferase involved in cell wall biosynthesis
MKPAISVCIIARDDAGHLERCFDSVAWADELVILVDSRSCDDTEKLARDRADRFAVRVYDGDIQQKAACVEQASHEWVLLIDPDESLAPDAEPELRRLAGSPSGWSGVELNRATYHLGRWIRHGDFYPDWKLRLFRKSRARFTGRNPHGRVEVEGRVARADCELQHFSYRDLAQQIDRIQFFSGESAEALDSEGRRVRWHDLLLRAPARFFRAYVLKSGWRDGVPGFIIAVNTAFHVFLKYAKLWERKQVGSRERDDRPRAR